MERALYLTSMDDVGRALDAGPPDRLYFGNEFCERKLPTGGELRAALAWCQERRLPLTLVTPPLTDAGLERVAALLDVLEEQPDAHEVVVSDFGLLWLLAHERPTLHPILGRLLARQHRDPRLARVLRGDGSLVMAGGRLWQHLPLPAEAAAVYRSCPLDVPRLRALLAELRVARVELDNVVQSFDVALPPTMAASLHLPWGCLTTSRRCQASPDEEPAAFACLVSTCRRACHTTYELSAPDLDEPLYKRGNTVFFRNEVLPPAADLTSAHVDRLVIAPKPPV